jgi:hypothetical protein
MSVNKVLDIDEKLLNIMEEIKSKIHTIPEEKKKELYRHIKSVFFDKPLDPELVRFLFLGWYINELYKLPSVEN